MKPDDSRRVFEGTRISVDVELWHGHEREIVRHPGAVAILAVDSEGRATFVRQLREPVRRPLLELPAGTHEPGEEPLATARRELVEEAGLAGGEWRLAARFYSTPGFCDELVHVYIAEGVEETERLPQDDEEIELVRVPVAELDGLLPQIEDAKTLAGLLLYLCGR
ncbi:MAG TPA: NUDIX hydrolase [Gaiellaceae bacterium]|nr:NUDIX hydrolase [Gaiellaceae bacterium]HKB21009.1 NUDIX hydrolase [Gaiellaceae bacterium]